METRLFDAVLGRGPVGLAVGDCAWLRALLDVEACLARACAVAGLVPWEAADRIADVCADEGAFPVGEIAVAAAPSGNPVVPLVRRISALTGPGAGAHVYLGATSQDVLDTARMLVARRALVPLLGDVSATAEAAAALADRHRDDLVAGRTLLQHALPMTFGSKAATWMTGLDGAADRLAHVAAGLPVQLFGAVGTHSALDGRGLVVVEALASELDLAVPVLSWHTLRLPVADLAGALGTVAGVVGKIALDVVLMAQTEVAGLAEGVVGRGGSSTMPHKRNAVAVAAVSARAGAARAPGLVTTLPTSMSQEHERAAGAWQAEWGTLSQLLRSVGSATSWTRDAFAHLHGDVDRMHRNLAATAGALGAEAVAAAVSPALVRAAAHGAVARAVRRAQDEAADLADALRADPELAPHLEGVDFAALLDPVASTGSATTLVDRALHAQGARTAPR